MTNTEQRTERVNRPPIFVSEPYESLRYESGKDTDEFTFSDFEVWTGCELTREYNSRARTRVIAGPVPGVTGWSATSGVSAGLSGGCGGQTTGVETAYYILADMVRGLGQNMRDELDIDAPARESEPARRERWVRTLVDRASNEYRLRNYSSAVVALDIAMEMAPLAEIAAHLMLRQSLSIHRIYQFFIGDMDAVPRLVVAMSTLDRRDVDSRAAFVLSRLDGMLTVDEFLDVVGSPRCEPMHCLCMMVLKGVVHLS